MKEQLTHAMCRVVVSRPDTAYDNFAADFGERFVPGYKRPSAVDLLFSAPFIDGFTARCRARLQSRGGCFQAAQ